jgi:hypothetical protein
MGIWGGERDFVVGWGGLIGLTELTGLIVDIKISNIEYPMLNVEVKY